MLLETERFVTLAAGISTIISVSISSWLISQHQKHFSRPHIQSKIVGILWMVPIYSCCSFISLTTPTSALYIDLCRDCYEAYVLYLFLALMLSYLSNYNSINNSNDESAVISIMESMRDQYPICPVSIFTSSPLPRGREFLKLCKFGTLQYCVIRPLTTFIAVILDLAGCYHESDFSPAYGYLYITLLVNMSVAYAFYILAVFYYAMKYDLKPYDPIPKFICIKAIIFFAFWQSVVIAGAVKLGIIRDIGPYSASRLSTSLQSHFSLVLNLTHFDFLICLEMLAVSIAHTYSFPFSPFVETAKTARAIPSVEEVMDDDGEFAEEIGSVYKELSNGEGVEVEGRQNDGSNGNGGTSKSSMITTTNTLGRRSSSNSSSSSSGATGRGKFVNSQEDQRSQKEDDRQSWWKRLWPSFNKSSTSNNRNNIYINSIHTTVTSSRTEAERSSCYEPPLLPSPLPLPSPSPPPRDREKFLNLLKKNPMVIDLDRHFAVKTALRDFNETMPVVLPTEFKIKRGYSVNSYPEERLRNAATSQVSSGIRHQEEKGAEENHSNQCSQNNDQYARYFVDNNG